MSICIDLRFHGQPHQREPWSDRIDHLIPSPALFTASLFLAAFYPEIVHLAELFCSPAWRPIAERAVTSPEHRAAITAQINRVLDRHTNPSHYDHNYVVTTWLQGMTSASRFEPDKTFPETRHNTIDGTPASPDALLLKRRRKARQEFKKHRHAPAWTLPRNIRQTSSTFPLPSQPVPQ
ncbi:hypothetical protein [Streptosporangium sp. NPDC023615]|uniref:hypothetical protein n=1 Tax=Streptosporangium sp. NPDC023615 TaxID=3154794 RepID=UPI00341A08F8